MRSRREDFHEFPNEPEKTCFYAPPNSQRQPRVLAPQRKRPSTAKPLKVRPEDRQESDILDMFLGTKRSFMYSHHRKGLMAVKIGESTWRTQEKLKAFAYQREFDLMTTNIRLRDDETLRRSNKPHPKWGEVFVGATTGPRPLKKLPREIQDTTYPRNHVLYFGP
jgi:hypothetical protein